MNSSSFNPVPPNPVSPSLVPTTQNRKTEHIRLCLDAAVECQGTTTGLERYRFRHHCLPELDFQEIALSTTFLGKSLQAPLLISCMTGGTDLAKTINRRLAIVAQAKGLPMGVGSQRVGLEQPEVMHTFKVRSLAPDILLFANLGAVQLNYGCGLDACRQIVDSLEADALVLHLNPLQECVQDEGDRNFRGLFPKIETLCRQLPVPVIAKEVGNGISAEMAQRLLAVGVRAIDVAGAGGTSWAKVEAARAQSVRQRQLGATFADWGIPTADCITQIRSLDPEVPLIASGGIRNGLEVAKAIALGADLVGMARPFLEAACESEEAIEELVDITLAELSTAMFCTGTPTVRELQTNSVLMVR